jgi:hypothetical protein
MKPNRYPRDQYPPTNCLAAAIRRLPRAAADVLPHRVGPNLGRYRVTFVVRQNVGHVPPAWFWGVDDGERMADACAPVEEFNDPEGGSGLP